MMPVVSEERGFWATGCMVKPKAVQTRARPARAIHCPPVSEKLGYTASGISRMMAALEEETGFPLLIRSRTGVIPTEECR